MSLRKDLAMPYCMGSSQTCRLAGSPLGDPLARPRCAGGATGICPNRQEETAGRCFLRERDLQHMSTELPRPRLVLTQQGSVFSYGQARQWEETGQAGQPGLALSLSPNLCLLLLLLGLHKVLALKSLVT